jgi:sigma-B regulation protein RsbU (phosphoserine phosphatase)
VNSPIPGGESDTPPLDFIHSEKSPSGDSAPKSARPLKRFRVLLIEDNDGDAVLLEKLLRDGAALFELVRADCLSAGLARLGEGGIDAVLLDLSLPDSAGLDTLERARASAAALPIVVLTGLDDRATGKRAVRHGAQDFLVKGQFESNLLVRSLRFAIERKRRQRAEVIVEANELKLEMAREIQQALLPVRDPEVAGFDISGASLATEAVGGDYFDYISLPHGCLGIAVGDATGHGVGPALMITQTQAYLRALALTHSGAGEILTLANRALADGFQQSRFVTLFLARVDPHGPSLIYSSAGHPESYHLGRGGELKGRLASNNLPLGLVPSVTFSESPPIDFEPGDLVLLLTDGVAETKGVDGASFGPERVLDTVRAVQSRQSREIVQHLLQVVQDFSRDLPLADDITAVAIKFVGPV